MQVFAWVFFMFGGINPEVAIYITDSKQKCMELQSQTGGQSMCKFTLILTEKQK